MPTRRQFLQTTVATLFVATIDRSLRPAFADGGLEIWVPLASSAPADDLPLIGPATGTVEPAIAWLSAHTAGYTQDDLTTIVGAYRDIGGADGVGLDWFLAIAQMALETGSLTSWWSQRPRRNPAGIGVTGVSQAGTAGSPPGSGWTWDGSRWLEGWSFPTWVDDAIPAHLGRLLAYALADNEATPQQQRLIDQALSYRRLPSKLRGSSRTIDALNGRWAVPGTDYGQHILALAQRIRSFRV